MDQAIARLQGLPDADQDWVADTILEVIGNLDHAAGLTAHQLAELRRRRLNLREGSAAFAREDDMADLWAHCGL